LENDKTLPIQSGKPVGIFETHADAGYSEPIQVAKKRSVRIPMLH